MSDELSFNRDESIEYGVIDTHSPLVRRIVARNPGPFTFKGTGTFIIGTGRVAVIDPGPDLAEHVDALLHALRGEQITHQLITHTHRDHSPASRAVQAATGAPTYGFGPHGAGRVERGSQVEEGGDMAFVPDEVVRDGDVVAGDGWTMDCVHTPGHTSNHVCFGLREEHTLFCGDHVMGWNTTIVSPPDGDMGAYLASLDKLLPRDDARYRPTHGPSIERPAPFVRAYIAHRQAREAQIVACMRDGLEDIGAMVARMYAKLPVEMHPAAGRQVLAQIVHLMERGRVRCSSEPALDARFWLA